MFRHWASPVRSGGWGAGWWKEGGGASDGMGGVGPSCGLGAVNCLVQGSGLDAVGRAMPERKGGLKKPAPDAWVPPVSLLPALATKQTYVTYTNHAI